MLIRVHPPMAVLYSTHQTTLGELKNYAGTSVRELYRYVADLDLLICGPQYWFYYGADGKPETKFTLEVALPVQGRIPTTLLPIFKQVPAFKCLCSRYEGPWEGLKGEYERMFKYIAAEGLKPSGFAAESFLHIDFAAPADQITEIQVGLL
ncbi:MAG: GyrI-like domain-containing protein [Bacteroidetes bacterium]|nr:GyrI-like domain-containing protein [Bacteroidota bacterium]